MARGLKFQLLDDRYASRLVWRPNMMLPELTDRRTGAGSLFLNSQTGHR